MFRSIGFNPAIQKIDNFVNNYRTWGKTFDKASVIKYHSDILGFLGKELKFRISGNRIDIYLKDYKLYCDIQNSMESYIVTVYEPASDHELSTLEQNTKIVLCNQYPHDNFKYKITFKSMPSSIRLNLINWAKKYKNGEILVNKSTYTYFEGLSQRHQFSPHYFYVKNEKMKTMATLAAQGYVRRIEEFVLRSSINIGTN